MEVDFRAFIEIGKNREISGVLDSVYFSPDHSIIGVHFEALEELATLCHWQMNLSAETFTRTLDESQLITWEDAGIHENEETIWFEGKLLPFTGICDRLGERIYLGDVVQTNDQTAIVIFVNGCFQLRWLSDPEAAIELLGYTEGKSARQVLIIGSQYLPVIRKMVEHVDTLPLAEKRPYINQWLKDLPAVG